ncbi:type I secretion system permease/ATPase [Sphingopyxis sp.]|jgi:PrtD family type I secretion system ABC transporter|uniref:type I secretion system permease/ATPase n=1 Tax=Sphingopyxis sp. TaxID=1908224 RepID=UPI0010F9EC53|nr:type I secretion system permease/ATPase [Sphingopyxis sp.]MBR2174921.1 type I secretion system permease/ATPase [Sphingopyxis sp.]
MRLFWMPVPPALSEAVRACRTHFILAATFSALINILYLAPTIYMMQVYDRVVPTNGVLTLVFITVVVGVAIATLSALDAIRVRLMARASLRLDRLLSGEILDRLLARSRARPGDPSTHQAMREFDLLRQSLAGPAATALFDVPWTPLYLLVAFLIHPILGVLVLGAGCVLVTLAIANERRSKAKAEEAHHANAAAYESHEAMLRRAEIVRALGMRRALVSRHIQQRSVGLNAVADLQFSGSRYNSLVKFVRMFMQSFALGVGAWLAINGQISVGAIIAASVLLSRALQPIEQLVGLWPNIVQSRQAIQTLGRLFDQAAGPVARTTLPDPEGQVELQGVVVRNADGSAILLKNIFLKLAPGEVLGIVGPSGAGKTTLARVVAGALPPDLGEIRVDGASMADWDPEQLAQHIGYLPQDCGLLPGTISENVSRFAVARGVPQAEVDEQVVIAARMAGVHEMILHLPGGYDTSVEGNGHRLSAGQAQRVALARALYGSPRILVLDEPNSALDSDGEEALSRAIGAAKLHGAAVMIVAHRAAVLASADRLAILADGAVVGVGPRDEILQALQNSAAKQNVVPIHEGARP